MAKQFIADKSLFSQAPFLKNAFNRAEGNAPFVGSMTTLASGVVSLSSILEGAFNTFFDRQETQDLSFQTVMFQFFPEDIRDSRRQNVGEKDLLLASDLVPTFGSASKRVLGFTCIFSQERINSTGDTLATQKNSVPEIPTADGPLSWDKYNFDVAISVQAIRSFAYPLKSQIGGSFNLFIQPVLLNLPGTLIGIKGDSIFGCVTSYDITYKAFFPNGRPRLAEVGIEFTEYPTLNPETLTGFFKQSFGSVIDAHSTLQKNVYSVLPLGPRAKRVIWENPIQNPNPPPPANESRSAQLGQ